MLRKGDSNKIFPLEETLVTKSATFCILGSFTSAVFVGVELPHSTSVVLHLQMMEMIFALVMNIKRKHNFQLKLQMMIFGKTSVTTEKSQKRYQRSCSLFERGIIF